jgi:hypothetical protein
MPCLSSKYITTGSRDCDVNENEGTSELRMETLCTVIVLKNITKKEREKEKKRKKQKRKFCLPKAHLSLSLSLSLHSLFLGVIDPHFW